MDANNVTMEAVLAKLEAIEAQLTDDDKKAEVKALRKQLADGSITAAKALTVLSLRGVRWGLSKSQPLFSRTWNGIKGFARGCWNEAEPKS